MQAFRTENNYRNASRLSTAELRAAMTSREILQSTALAFDTQRQLRFELGGCRAVMPFGQCADGADTGSVRDIAVLTRVGRPTCFVIEGIDTDENGQPFYRLSRAEAKRMCKAEYLDQLQPGDILPCVVTHIEPFGAFCDVGCGISALLPIDCMSVSRISSPADRVSVGQQILCAIKSRDAQGRFVLTIRELLGTWAENAAAFWETGLPSQSRSARQLPQRGSQLVCRALTASCRTPSGRRGRPHRSRGAAGPAPPAPPRP